MARARVMILCCKGRTACRPAPIYIIYAIHVRIMSATTIYSYYTSILRATQHTKKCLTHLERMKCLAVNTVSARYWVYLCVLVAVSMCFTLHICESTRCSKARGNSTMVFRAECTSRGAIIYATVRAAIFCWVIYVGLSSCSRKPLRIVFFPAMHS